MPEYKERAPGTYRARFVKLDEHYMITDRDSGEEVERWRWLFQEVDDSTTVGQIDTLTSVGFKSRSNGLKFFTGMLGRPPREGDNTDDLIGQVFDVTYGPNQNGRYTIVAVSKPVDRGLREATAKAAEQKAIQEGETATYKDTTVAVTDPAVDQPMTSLPNQVAADELPF